MSRHLADHQRAQTGGRVKHFLRIARKEGEAMWQSLRQKPRATGDQSRLREFVRIERGRKA